jgi:hypothetical protein
MMLSNAGGLVYGTITVGALLAAESAKRETYPETVGAVLVALALYWIAHAYSDFTAERLKAREALSLKAFGRALRGELTVLFGAVIPLLALLVWWAAGARLSVAVTAAIWVAAAVTALIEFGAALRAELRGRELAVQTTIGVLLGLLVVALMLVLHH